MSSPIKSYPRTLRDFQIIDLLVERGWSDSKVDRFLQSDWRSEVKTLAGKLHCAECLQPISIHRCLECGQTLQEMSI